MTVDRDEMTMRVRSSRYEDAPESLLLRRTLLANAAFSVLTGVIALLDADVVAALMGIAPAALLEGLGVLLLVYAGILVMAARRRHIKRFEAWNAILSDALWCAGALVIIALPSILTVTGDLILGLVSLPVLVFGVLQYRGLQRL